MVARVTLAEIDLVRTTLADELRRLEEAVLPALREQDGFEGVYALATPDGKALLLTLWASADAAEAGIASGFYARQVSEFVTVFRAPPGRETYDVLLAETPVAAGR